MDVAIKAKQMLQTGKMAVNKSLEERILNDQLTNEDINLLKRNFNILEHEQSKYKK